MVNKNENYPEVRLLSDDTVDADQFAGKAHERVSKGLSSIITSNGDGGYAIGLEGSWGSGKSSVITMLENEFLKKDDSDIICFTFDCWAHIGDPMKRSFLESLVNFLKFKKLISDKIIKQLLNRIRVRETVINITKKPFVPKYIYQLAVYVVVLPFLIILISSLLSAEIYLLWWDFSVINFILAIALIGFGIWYPISISKKEYKRRKESEDKNLRDQPVLPIFSFERELTQSQDFTQTESGDKTSIEFNEIFVEILGKIGEKKLVIVLDNLDRLEDEDVREIWGSLRNFFTSNKDTQNRLAQVLQKVTLIVPYDRSLILKAFERSNGISQTLSSEEKLSGNAGFIEKTFKTIIKVPDPILIHWKQFFSDNLRTAFFNIGIDAQSEHEIFKYFDHYFSTGDKRLSPRSIKFLINEMVVIYYQWEDEIPLKYIALFVTNRQKIESASNFNPKNYLNDNFYNDLEMDTKWYEYILALRYNVKVDDVMHVVLSREMVSTLNKGEDKEIEELRNHDGIFDIFEKVISEKGFQSNFRDVPEKLLRFIIGTKKFQVPGIFITKARNVLFNLILYFSNDNKDRLYLLKSSYLSEGILSLAELETNDQRKSHQLIALLNILTPKEVDVAGDSTDENRKLELSNLSNYWVLMEKAIDFLSNCFENKKDFKASIKEIKLPGISLSFPLTTTYNLYKCWEDYEINLFSFNQVYIVEDLIDFLEDEFSNNTFEPEKVVEVTRHILHTDTDKARNHIDSLLATLTKKIKELAGGNTSNENERDLIIFLNTLFAIEEILSGSTVESIKELDKTRAFHKALRFNKIKNDQSLFPKIFFNLIVHGRISLNSTDTRRHPNLNSISRFISDLLNGKALEEDMFNELVNLAVSNYQSVVLPLPTKYLNKYPLFIEIARAMVLSGKLTNQSIEYLIKNYNKYPLMQEEEERNKFFQCILDARQKGIESLRITDIPISLLTDLKNENGNAFNLMVKFIKEKLSSFTSSEWESIFEGKGGELKYLEYLEGQKFLDKDFKDQLLKITKQAIQNEEFSVTDEKIINNFPKLLENKVSGEFYKQVQVELVKSYQTNTSFVSGLIDRLGREILMAYPPVSKEHANSLIRNLIIPFIKDDQFALGWVEFNLTQVKAFYNKSSTEVKDNLKVSINRIYQKIVNRSDLEEKEELLSQINSIAKGLKIKLIESK
jgi:hypothetical protein